MSSCFLQIYRLGTIKKLVPMHFHKDELHTRVTTLIHTQLTLYALVSVRQHSGLRNVHHSVTAYLQENAFGVQLLEVFNSSFPCASHQPAAFCKFPLNLLVPIIAFLIKIASITLSLYTRNPCIVNYLIRFLTNGRFHPIPLWYHP